MIDKLEELINNNPGLAGVPGIDDLIKEAYEMGLKDGGAYSSGLSLLINADSVRDTLEWSHEVNEALDNLGDEDATIFDDLNDELVKKIADEIHIDFAWESNQVSEAIFSEVDRASKEIAVEIVKQHLNKKN